MLNKILFLTFLMLAIAIIGCSAETTSAPTAPYPAPQNPPPALPYPPPAPPYPAPQGLPAARPTASPIVELARSVELTYQSGNLDQAFMDYTKIIEPDLKNADAYYNRGLAYEDQGDAARAFADYSKAIALNPNFGVAYLNRGALYREQGRKAEAVADLGKYLELSPNAADRAQIEEWLRELKGQ
jgi:tetratricopeptide (TPR) repeat protein